MSIGHIAAIVSLAAVLLAPPHSFGGALEDGSAALEQKDYKKAFSLLLPVAKEGNSFAQYNIALMYAQGLGVEKNEEEAVKWYRKAAEQNDPDAQTNLGLMYAQGRGIARDYQEAMKWYVKAAEKGMH